MAAAAPAVPPALTTLPPDALSFVLAFADVDDVVALGGACKAARDVALGPHLWRRLDLSARPRCYDVNDEHLSRMLAIAAQARGRDGGPESLDLSGCIDLTDAGCAAIADQCARSLRDLVVDGTDGFRVRRITDAGVRAIAVGCTALERVTLRCAHTITDDAIRALAAAPGATSRLRHLDITGCHNLGAGSVAAIRALTALTSLHIAGCRSMPADALADLFAGALPPPSMEAVAASDAT
eukprot:CAMPEP_0203816968 /NCGR_PEP_ID=MMETSP0115-20131106/18252_1 /ASSEMBLY_ACC=CAM_ASM_000227 /TAXON_ID=33651 /ORGANISM="Bicosoecid sp, Strain ms1" /LENGTH=238 /DNA_ID=CAMNT_0050725883 /DNA_START=207 /DNA_END=920 /DNA_ORIENTATION=+